MKRRVGGGAAAEEERVSGGEGDVKRGTLRLAWVKRP